MHLYLIGLVVSVVAWVVVTANLTVAAVDKQDPVTARRARLSWLAFFLLPLYPFVLAFGVVVVPILWFRRLGIISRKKTVE